MQGGEATIKVAGVMSGSITLTTLIRLALPTFFGAASAPVLVIVGSELGELARLLRLFFASSALRQLSLIFLSPLDKFVWSRGKKTIEKLIVNRGLFIRRVDLTLIVVIHFVKSECALQPRIVSFLLIRTDTMVQRGAPTLCGRLELFGGVCEHMILLMSALG